MTATLESDGGSLSTASWKELTPFVYRSGSLDPPKLLRTIPDQNYLSPAVRAVGLSLMSLALFASVSASIWVFFRKKHAVVRKTQPFALHLICFGSFVSSWSIFPLSFDESYGWSKEQLDEGCMSVAWLVSIGHIITYGGTSLLRYFFISTPLCHGLHCFCPILLSIVCKGMFRMTSIVN